MVLAISRFRVANAMRDDVERAFLERPGLVDHVPGFVGLEVHTDVDDPAIFHLLTRWTDVDSFRTWHSSTAHHESHRGIPKGLRLDAAYTELVYWRSVGSDPVANWLPLVSEHLLKHDASCYVVAGADGTIGACSNGMASAVQVPATELIGRSLFDFMAAPSRAAIQCLIATRNRRREPMLLNFATASGDRFTLECRVDVQPDAFALAGAVPRQQTREYMQTLEELNNRLCVEIRESARKEKELERLNRKLQETLNELDTAYWHLRKIQEVLPICLECGKVKTGEGSWESVIDYLKANSHFLSHGYCPECYSRLRSSLE